MTHNKSRFKRKPRIVQPPAPVRRHGPRRNAPCCICEYVVPARHAEVFTVRGGKKLEVCLDCKGEAVTTTVSGCHNCGDWKTQSGLRFEDGTSFCERCVTSMEKVSEHYAVSRSDAESVF